MRHSGASTRPAWKLPRPRLVDALRRGGELLQALSVVAVAERDVVGHVGAAPRGQRQGVGRALMHGVLAAADALDEVGVGENRSPRSRTGSAAGTNSGVYAVVLPSPGGSR
jgi:predicted N-acetyltransferase YhbS